MHRKSPTRRIAAIALALLGLLALHSPAVHAENPICASLTPTHPAWGIYGCGAADAEQQEQVLEGIGEVQASLDEIQSQLDALDTKLTIVGDDVQDVESLATQIASGLADLDVDVAKSGAGRFFDNEPLDSQDTVEVMSAQAGHVLLATCSVTLRGQDDRLLSFQRSIDGVSFTAIELVQGDERFEDDIVIVAKELQIKNVGNSRLTDGWAIISCSALELPI